MSHLASGSIDISTPWSLWRTYFVNEVLLSNNLVNSEGTLSPLVFSFLGILVTFLLTRAVTRFIRHRSSSGAAPTGPIRDIVIGGVHIHHQVFGIVLMMLSGLALVGFAPTGAWLATGAFCLGVGIGLAFDEFALWLHLDDVYWDPRGQKSVDAVAIVLVLTGVVAVVAGTVTDLRNAGPIIDLLGARLVWLLVTAVALTFVPPVICLLKGKPITGGLGVAYIPLGVVGAVRLAKPDSWWARHLYPVPSRRWRRAADRFGARYEARWNRIRHLVGGAPTAP